MASVSPLNNDLFAANPNFSHRRAVVQLSSNLARYKMQRFDENRGRLEEVDEGAEEDLDYNYEQVVENGEDAVGSRRRPKKPEELENCAEKKIGKKIGAGNTHCHASAQSTAMPGVSPTAASRSTRRATLERRGTTGFGEGMEPGGFF
jgi:hypothetical protein